MSLRICCFSSTVSRTISASTASLSGGMCTAIGCNDYHNVVSSCLIVNLDWTIPFPTLLFDPHIYVSSEMTRGALTSHSAIGGGRDVRVWTESHVMSGWLVCGQMHL